MDARPATPGEKERFSSGGRPFLLVLRGQWGLRVDRALLWATGYSLVTAQYAWATGQPYTDTLMLTTIGAKTGAPRVACLPYFRVGEDFVVRGSNGGGPTDPHWVYNVRAHPEARIRLHRRERAVRAHVASGEERERLYAALCEQSASTEAYQRMCAPRELPLVVLRGWDAGRAAPRPPG